MAARGGFGVRTVKVILLGVLVGAAGAWVLWPQPADRDLLDRLVVQAKHGFESKSLPEIMDCVAPDYQDGSGLTRRDVSRVCGRVVARAEQVKIRISEYDLSIHSPTATGHFDVMAVLDVGGETVTWPMRLEVSFVKQHRSWRGLWRPHWVVTAVDGHGLDKNFEDLF